jgi:long-chain acyl-CoA synthetase
VRYVVEHSGARVAVASDRGLLETLLPLGGDLDLLEYLLRAEEIDESAREEVEGRLEATQLVTVAELRVRGAERLADEPEAPRRLREQLQPDDLATIIYTSGTTGEPQGVELTHQNVTSNALDSFAGLSGLERGPQEVAISFLPLTHVFQRTMQYGFMNYGHTVYFTEPEDLGRHFPEVKPTIFATVPRILERVLEKIQMRGGELEGWRRRIFDFAMERARDHEVGRSYGPWDRALHTLADFFVYRRWRNAVGGRTRFIISGGAALRPEIVELFDAAGITILQGYGLTETSPVISFNRPEDNRPGTVGVPIAGVEAKIAEDGEILTRGPHVMRGYYDDEAATREVIDEDGWFHTGDVGAIEDGHLRVTDRKKSLFKLSTGKYVIPQPLENSLDAEFLVDRALVVGRGVSSGRP